MKPRTLLCTAALVFFLPYSAVANEWRGLVVAPEERCAPYNADEYSYPQSVEPKIADRLGGLYSPYTCETFGELTETDIEHIVARSEAHDSGLCASLPERKREFARDIRNLTLSAPHLNRNLKAAKDAADWVPEENKCWFAGRGSAIRGWTCSPRNSFASGRGWLRRCRPSARRTSGFVTGSASGVPSPSCCLPSCGSTPAGRAGPRRSARTGRAGSPQARVFPASRARVSR